MPNSSSELFTCYPKARSRTRTNSSHGPQVAVPSTPTRSIVWSRFHLSETLRLRRGGVVILKCSNANVKTEKKSITSSVTTRVVQLNCSHYTQQPTRSKMRYNPSRSLEMAAPSAPSLSVKRPRFHRSKRSRLCQSGHSFPRMFTVEH